MGVRLVSSPLRDFHNRHKKYLKDEENSVMRPAYPVLFSKYYWCNQI
jgi:hypothetical protein